MTSKGRRCDNKCKSKMRKIVNKMSKYNIYYNTCIFSLSCQLLIHPLTTTSDGTQHHVEDTRLIVLMTCQRTIDSD
ncbi:hypothetical protein HKD37_18G051414 [Glycine soja]